LKATAANVCLKNQSFDIRDTNRPEEKLIWLSTTVKQTRVVTMNEPSGLFVVSLKSSVWFLRRPEVSWEIGGPEPQSIYYFVEHRRRFLITPGQTAVRSPSPYSCCNTDDCHVGGCGVHQAQLMRPLHDEYGHRDHQAFHPRGK